MTFIRGNQYHTDDLTDAQYKEYLKLNELNHPMATNYAVDCIHRNFAKDKFPEDDEL